MGLFDFLKKKKNNPTSKNIGTKPEITVSFSVPSAKEIEQQASVEAEKIAQIDALSKKSEHGLPVSQILLLEYCKKGKYPNPEGGYQRFWWFEFGMKSVGEVLKKLENDGFIRYATPSDLLPSLKVNELKEILAKLELPMSGRKADLVERISQNADDVSLKEFIRSEKYTLTELGEKEVEDNQYIPYLYAHKYPEISIWDVNQNADLKHWRDYIWGKFNQYSMEYASKGQWELYRNVRFSMAEFLCDEDKYADAVAMYTEVCFYDVNGRDVFIDYDSPSDLLFEGIITRMKKVAREGNIDDEQLRVIISKRVKDCAAVKCRVPKGEMTDLIINKLKECLL